MIIAIDGYDGSGKTTIALQISKRINGTYVKSYNNDLGRVIWSLINDEEYELASLIARTACRKEAERYKDAPYVIFDRHWMTMFTLIPEEFLDSWFPLPFTVLIEAETQTIVERLNKRNEKVDTPFEVHLDQQQRFREVAERHQVAVINTSSELADTSVNRIISLINGG